MREKPTSLLDIRVPQPSRLSDYGVPASVSAAAEALWAHRNICDDAEVDVIDAALWRLFGPWIREEQK